MSQRRMKKRSSEEIMLELRAAEMKTSRGPKPTRDPKDLSPAHGTSVAVAPRKTLRAWLRMRYWRFVRWWRYGWGGPIR